MEFQMQFPIITANCSKQKFQLVKHERTKRQLIKATFGAYQFLKMIPNSVKQLFFGVPIFSTLDGF